MEYTDNFRKNLELYWRQFYPDWEIPKGYHVHHIKPKCTFEDVNDPDIHHPRNLIALHPDDHVTIHKCRGDDWADESFLKVLGNKSSGMKGKHHSAVSKEKMRRKLKGKKLPKEVAKKRKGAGNPFYGKKHTDTSKKKMSVSSLGQGKDRIVSEETKKKLSDLKRGKKRKPFTDEHKMKISKSLKGIKRPPMSEEHKEKIRAARLAHINNK